MNIKNLCKLVSVFSLLTLLFFQQHIKAMENVDTNSVQNDMEIYSGDSLADYGDEIPSESEQIVKFLSEQAITDEQREILERKLMSLSEKESRGVYPAKTISMVCFNQNTSYYCGPATTKQTINYIMGKSDSQDNIAKALGTTSAGTDGHRIVTYLNGHQKRSKYIIATKPSISDFKTKIDVSIRNYNIPVVVRVKFDKRGSWLYSTNGHYMNVSGFKKGISHVEITDPNIRRVNKNNKTGKYYVTINEIVNAINNHPKQEYYW